MMEMDINVLNSSTPFDSTIRTIKSGLFDINGHVYVTGLRADCSFCNN